MAEASAVSQFWVYLASNIALAHTAGVFSSFCFLLQYVPQIMWNFTRKSVKGFSPTGIVIKLVGASFLLINAFLTGENTAVILYGLCNVVQHSIFMLQFSTYPHDDKESSGPKTDAPKENKVEKKEHYLLWLMFPFVPLFFGLYAPSTMAVTNSVKPLTQVLSHLPQLKICYSLKTTSGVAMMSQHLNFVGGFAGLYMCLVLPPVSPTVYLIYINSVLQAISLYSLAIYYDGWLSSKPRINMEPRNV